MSRTGSDHLHRLIGSLSRSEKGYFKKHSQLHVIGESNNYLRLFEAISKQKVYNESRLQKQLNLNSRQFATVKNYLHRQLLKVLSNFHAGNDPLLEIQEGYQQALILRRKGFLVEAGRRLRRLAKRSGELGHWQILTDILSEERLLVLQSGGSQTALQEISDELQTAAALLQKVKKWEGFLFAWNQHWQGDLFLFEAGEMESQAQRLLSLLEAETHFSLRLRCFWLRALVQVEQRQELFTQGLEILKNKPPRPDLHWQFVFGFFQLSEALLQHSFSGEIIKVGLPFVPDEVEAQYYLNFYRLRADPKLPDSEISQITLPAPDQASGGGRLLRFALGSLALLQASKTGVQDYLRPLVEANTSGPHTDLYPSALLISLAAYLQNGENLFLEYRVRNVIRELKSTGQLDKGARVVLRFLDRASRFAGTPQVREAAAKALQQLSGEEKLLAYFDFRQWIQTHT